MNIIRDLKQFNADTAQLEDMVVLAAIGKLSRAEFELRNIPVPEWLDTVNRTLTTAIDNQTREAKILRLRELQAEEDRLMPVSERRQKVAEQRAKLEQELAGAGSVK